MGTGEPTGKPVDFQDSDYNTVNINNVITSLYTCSSASQHANTSDLKLPTCTCKYIVSIIHIHVQSNLDYPDIDYPDFSIIRTFSLVLFFFFMNINDP